MRPRVVFFCGDQSPYGRAHLRAVLEEFDVVAVVLATAKRWAQFRQALSGMSAPLPPGFLTAPWQALRTRAIKPLLRRLRQRPASYIDVPAIVRRHGVELIWCADVNSAGFLRQIRQRAADLFISAAYPQIFSAELLAVPPRGAVNFHPSLLPRFRGAHPHFWAIVHGEKTGGISAHFMTARVDEGDLIAQLAFPIADLTYSQLYSRINQETPALVRQVAAFLQDPSARPRPQDHSQATCFRNDRDIHRRIFWQTHTAEQVRNLCRTEKAVCFFRGRPITPLTVSVAASNRNLTNGVVAEPGSIVDIHDGLVTVKATDGCVQIATIAAAGRHWTAPRWASRNGVQIGQKLE